jgi:hypothetical protein
MANSNFLTFDFDPVRVMEKISLIKTNERKMEYIAIFSPSINRLMTMRREIQSTI